MREGNFEGGAMKSKGRPGEAGPDGTGWSSTQEKVVLQCPPLLAKHEFLIHKLCRWIWYTRYPRVPVGAVAGARAGVEAVEGASGGMGRGEG